MQIDKKPKRMLRWLNYFHSQVFLWFSPAIDRNIDRFWVEQSPQYRTIE